MRLAESIIGRYPPADENFPWAHLLRGARFVESLQLGAAEKEFREVLQQAAAGLADPKGHGPGSALTHASFGTSLLEQQQNEDAVAQFSWAVALDPGSDQAHRGLCDGLHQAQRLDEALNECSLVSQRSGALLPSRARLG